MPNLQGKSVLRIFAGTVLLALSCASMTLLAPAQASAASCFGNYCSGKDPKQTRCGEDGITVASAQIPGTEGPIGILELRWSRKCQANWARVTAYPTGARCFPPGSISAIQDTGYKVRGFVPIRCAISQPVTYWSPMIYSPKHKVRAQYCKIDRCGGWGEYYSTGWR